MKKLMMFICLMGLIAFPNAFAKEKADTDANADPAKTVTKEDSAPKETPKDKAPDNDKAAVTVNGQKISASRVAEELQKRINVMKKRMPAGQEMPEEQVKQMHRRLTDSLVEQALIEQMAKEAGVTVTDEQIMEEIKKFADQQNKSVDDFEAYVAENFGMTVADLKGQIHTQVLAKTLVEKKTADLKVTEEDAKKFYDENPQHFEHPEQVRASHILIKFEPNASDEQKAAAKEKIEGLLKRARAGEDFAALAKEYTEDPGSKETGGEYTFPRGQMVKPFEDAAFGLEVGKISDVIETQFGYHIIKLSEKMEAGKTPFDEVKPKITEYLEETQKQQKWSEIQKAFRDKATIVYSEEEQALRDELDKLAAERSAGMMGGGMIRPRTEAAAEPKTESAEKQKDAPAEKEDAAKKEADKK